MMAAPGTPNTFYTRAGKRVLDRVLAILGIVVLAPVFFGVAVAVRWKLGAPVLFRQTRPGKDGKPFTMLKFRTMLEAHDADGVPLPDEERLTSFGRFLRTASLDELPELVNVVKGDMSLVGPRPLLMQYLERYSSEQARRHEVRPGVTGWAQVNGRNAVSWRQKFEYDVWYVDNISLLLDLRIMFRTIMLVFAREGISQPGSATATEFRGSLDD